MPSVKGIDALKAAFNRFIALSLMPAQMIELKNTQLFADDLRLHRELLRAIDTDMTACAPHHDAIVKMRWRKRYFVGEKCDQTERWGVIAIQSDAISLRGGSFVTSASCAAHPCHQPPGAQYRASRWPSTI
jgi:hypothetical protein